MADETEDRTDAPETVAAEFHVPLEPNNRSVSVASEGEDADETEATEQGTDETVEATAEAAEEEKTAAPSAEELGVDTSTPEGKRQYKALLAQWNKWYNRHSAKLAAKPDPTPEPAKASEPEVQGDAWDPYVVPLDKFVYDGGKESEDSVLAGAEADIDRRIQKGVAEGIKFALNEMRQNDARLRQQAAVGTAQERISAYAEALQSHPEWADKAPLVAKIAAGTKDLAIQDPDEWIAMVEARTGILRNWREEAQAEESAASVQRSQRDQRLAGKPRASVARPTNGSAALVGPPRGDMGFDRAFDAAWSKARH